MRSNHFGERITGNLLLCNESPFGCFAWIDPGALSCRLPQQFIQRESSSDAFFLDYLPVDEELRGDPAAGAW